MSNLKLYQMYDSKAQQVIGPILTATRDEAVIRQFTDVLTRKETLPGQYPEDFALLQIGEQNQDTGDLTPNRPNVIYLGEHWLRLQQLKVDSSSPANTNTAGEQPPTLMSDEERNRQLHLTR